MPHVRFEELPETLRVVRTRPLFAMRLVVPSVQVVGATPAADRRVGVIVGGSFAGERLRGDVLDGGSDWQSVRADGGTSLDVRLVLRTDDEALIAVTYRGIRHGPADVLRRLGGGEAVDPASYYFRTHLTFETSAAKYGWLNRILAIGIGHRLPDGPVYSVFEFL